MQSLPGLHLRSDAYRFFEREYLGQAAIGFSQGIAGQVIRDLPENEKPKSRVFVFPVRSITCGDLPRWHIPVQQHSG